MLYLIFEKHNTPPLLQNIDESILENNTYLKTLYYLEKAPEIITPQNYYDYHIALTENKELIINKKTTTLHELKEEKKKACLDYGNSPNVDSLNVNGIDIVVDTNLRQKLYERLRILKEKGLTEDTLIFGNIQITQPIPIIEHTLNNIAYRAMENFDILQQHLKNIDTLTNETDLQQYDFTTNYKPKLSFNL